MEEYNKLWGTRDISVTNVQLDHQTTIRMTWYRYLTYTVHEELKKGVLLPVGSKG